MAFFFFFYLIEKLIETILSMRLFISLRASTEKKIIIIIIPNSKIENKLNTYIKPFICKVWLCSLRGLDRVGVREIAFYENFEKL